MRSLRAVALGLVLLLAQSLVVDLLPPHARPDLPLIFAMAMGLRRGSETRALLLAFGIGFALDVLNGNPPGLWALLRGTACVATRVFDQALYLRAAIPWGVYATGWALADWALQALVVHTFLPKVSLPWDEVLRTAPLSSLITGVCAALLLGVLRRFDGDAERDGAWGLATSGSARR
jgi:rod shape-determining protein MreD